MTREHGTSARYRYGGCRCEPCTEAYREHARTSSAAYRKRHAHRLRPCGTVAGANRHRENGETPCAECTAALAVAVGLGHAQEQDAAGRFISTQTPEERFMSLVAKTAGDWLWTGGLDQDGYGLFKTGGRTIRAHRWAYEHFVGPIPAGLVLDHLCRVRGCVNPEHLEPVTAAENTVRGRSAKREITHCPAGHEYTPENTYRQPSRPTSRRCRACADRRKR